MSRSCSPGGRFTSDVEQQSISNGIDADLKRPVGTTCQWWLFDATDTKVDPIYDVGDSYLTGSGGKVWYGPFSVSVISARLQQGDTKISQQGFYNADYLHLTINANDIEKASPGTMANPDFQDRSRVVWKGQVYRPYKSQQVGLISETFTLLAVDLVQVMGDELINDPQFLQYALP
jgi:hypothetical protein